MRSTLVAHVSGSTSFRIFSAVSIVKCLIRTKLFRPSTSRIRRHLFSMHVSVSGAFFRRRKTLLKKPCSSCFILTMTFLLSSVSIIIFKTIAFSVSVRIRLITGFAHLFFRQVFVSDVEREHLTFTKPSNDLFGRAEGLPILPLELESTSYRRLIHSSNGCFFIDPVKIQIN